MVLSTILHILALLTMLCPLLEEKGNYLFGEDGEVANRSSALAELLPYSPPDSCIALKSEQVKYLGRGRYSVTRTIVNKSNRETEFNDVLKVRDMFKASNYTIPCVNYNGNDYDGGVVIYNGLNLGMIKVPTGIDVDGEPWVFSYQRTGVPSCTLSENESLGLAVFAANDSNSSLVSSCAFEMDNEGHFIHVIVRPVVESPYTYESKGIFGPKYVEKITLKPGECFTSTSYVCVCPPKYPNYAIISLIEHAFELLDTNLEISMDDEQVWGLAQRYIRSLLYNYQGKWLTATNRKQRMFAAQHRGHLSREEMAEMQKWEYWTDVATFLPGFEIGWAGHNFMNGRMLAIQALKDGDEELLKKAIGIFDAFIEKQGRNGMLLVRYNLYFQKGLLRKSTADVCNLGWGAQESLRMYKLLKEHGIDKPELISFSRRICDFFIHKWNANYGFGKSWKLNGRPVQTKGSIGGFMIPAMLELYELTGESKYLEMAEKACDFYYTRDLDRFICTAGAIDCNCIDKETSYPFLQASLMLYKITHNVKYLERAEKAAAYFCSWMFYFDPIYEAHTDFAKYNYHATGGTSVSAEHHVIDPWGGIMAPDLYELSKLSGNPIWDRLGRIMWANALQGITTKLGDFYHDSQRPIGSQNEAFFQARFNKYRPTIEAGYFNDLLVAWPQSYRLWTLERMHNIGERLK